MRKAENATGALTTAYIIRVICWLVLFAAGITIWILYLSTSETARALRALLVNFLYFTPLAAGFMAWSAALTLTNARWAGQLEMIPLRGIAFALPSLIALGGLWIGATAFSPWPGKSYQQGAWLNSSFLFGRDLGLMIIFWAIAFWYARRRMSGRGYAQAAVLAIVYVTVFTIIGFDLVMALAPPWYSTVFGLYFFTSGMYIAISAWTFIAVVGRKASKSQIHDCACLLVGLSLLSTYLMYSQVLTQWYENLPDETIFILPRRSGRAWPVISYVLLGVIYLGPMVVLLTVWAKRNSWFLGSFSGIVLVGLWLERYWLVGPFLGVKPGVGVVEVAMTAAFIGTTGIVFELFGLWMPERLPERRSASE